MTWRRGRCGGQKARERQQGGRSTRAGNIDGTVVATQTTQGDGADKAQWQCARDRYGTDGAMTPPLEASGAERGGNGGADGDRLRGTAESTRSAFTPSAMVAAVAPPGQEGLPDKPVGRFQGAFWA